MIIFPKKILCFRQTPVIIDISLFVESNTNDQDNNF